MLIAWVASLIGAMSCIAVIYEKMVGFDGRLGKLFCTHFDLHQPDPVKASIKLPDGWAFECRRCKAVIKYKYTRG